MESVSVAEAKAHLSNLLTRIERGREILITRRGRPVAKMSPVEGAKKPIDFEALRRLRARQPMSRISAAELIRKMRDEGY